MDAARPLRVAVIGSGVAGLVAARTLAAQHEVTLFEAGSYIGGHSNTIDVERPEGKWAVDTGFIVHNRKTYPNFIKLLEELKVETQPSEMSFSVACDKTGLEYCGSSLNQIFAQRRNLLRPDMYRMLADIMRLHRLAPAYLQTASPTETVGEFLKAHSFSDVFRDRYFIPISASIWSALPGRVMEFPSRFILGFMMNHGMLQVENRPQWRVVTGGSRVYVETLLRDLQATIFTGTKVVRVQRHRDRIAIEGESGPLGDFDYVVLACHSDQALQMLGDQATTAERQVLSAIPYQKNEAVLHTDTRVLPKSTNTWSSWNYRINAEAGRPVSLTYNMNILQNLKAPVTFCVTLNDDGRIDPETVIRRIPYAHPVFYPEAVAAQARQREINGRLRVYYCGAYWRNGFHEDGVVSALAACDHFAADTDGGRSA